MIDGIPTNKKAQVLSQAKGGKILAEVLEEVLNAVKPGMTEREVDTLAEKLILKKGGEVGFKKVYDYQYATCISTNDVVVHGIPTDRALEAGDIIGVDCGVYLDGYHTDMSDTIRVPGKSQKTVQDRDIERFIATGTRALFAGIMAAKAGNRVGHISEAIQSIVEGEGGYSIVRNLVGHGVGRDLHEDPEIPGYKVGPLEKTPLLKVGMTLAIEVIYNMGGKKVKQKKGDEWTIYTADGSLSGVCERTLVITSLGPRLLTARPTDPVPAWG